MRLFVMVAGVMACIAGLTGCSASSSTTKKDVTVTSCAPGANGGRPVAAGRVDNHSSKASFYAIHVRFKDSSGNVVADGVAAVAKVEPGATANWHAVGSAHAKGPLKCSLSSVTRTISP
jgi:hypothetical protein